MKKVISRLIGFYQYLISPFIPPSCRFYPTCSEYAIQAINRHGILKGCLLTLCRITRCQPFCEGGHDPVP